MIAALVLSIALASTSDAGVPHVLSARAACALSHSDHINAGTLYSIKGEYARDWEWGAVLDVPGCDLSITPRIDGEAADRLEQFRDAFKIQCGGYLTNDRFWGIFTGSFVRQTRQFAGKSFPDEVFIITHMQTKDLDTILRGCRKK